MEAFATSFFHSGRTPSLPDSQESKESKAGQTCSCVPETDRDVHEWMSFLVVEPSGARLGDDPRSGFSSGMMFSHGATLSRSPPLFCVVSHLRRSSEVHN